MKHFSFMVCAIHSTFKMLRIVAVGVYCFQLTFLIRSMYELIYKC